MYTYKCKYSFIFFLSFSYVMHTEQTLAKYVRINAFAIVVFAFVTFVLHKTPNYFILMRSLLWFFCYFF